MLQPRRIPVSSAFGWPQLSRFFQQPAQPPPISDRQVQRGQCGCTLREWDRHPGGQDEPQRLEAEPLWYAHVNRVAKKETAVDTNVMLRFVQPNDPEYGLVRKVIRALTEKGETLEEDSR
jgi:hypothetical protein